MRAFAIFVSVLLASGYRFEARAKSVEEMSNSAREAFSSFATPVSPVFSPAAPPPRANAIPKGPRDARPPASTASPQAKAFPNGPQDARPPASTAPPRTNAIPKGPRDARPPASTAPPLAENPSFEVIKPALRLVPENRASRILLATMDLPAFLDKNREIESLVLGDSTWDIGIAADATLHDFFLSFKQGETLVFYRLKNLGQFLSNGVDVTIRPGLAYNFSVSVNNIFNPFYGSSLVIQPDQDVVGPSYNLGVADIINALKSKAVVFTTPSGTPYDLLYATDVDPSAGTPASTRSLIFLHESGLHTRAWPVAESDLHPGRPVEATLDQGDAVTLMRNDSGRLLLYGSGN